MKSLTVIVGSKNSQKSAAVIEVFEEIFSEPLTLITVAAPSEVAEAPYNEDTYQGALNRARFCQQQAKTDADICIGLESGIAKRAERLFEETWVVILMRQQTYVGYSSGLVLPKYVTELMEARQLTHNEAMRRIDAEMNIAGGTDTWSTYTGGQLLRKISMQEAVRNAAIQLRETPQSLYQKSGS